LNSDMTLFHKKFRIESTRLPDWDYSSDGYYFITICTKGRKCIFGEIRNGIMGLNELGVVAWEQWLKTAKLRKNIILDEFIVMPNHIHGIIIIDNASVETHCNASLQNNNKFGPQHNNLASIVRGYKSAVKLTANKMGFCDFAWQPSYYDRIIDSEEGLNHIREYIRFNPEKWEIDRNNPKNL